MFLYESNLSCITAFIVCYLYFFAAGNAYAKVETKHIGLSPDMSMLTVLIDLSNTKINHANFLYPYSCGSLNS